MPPTPLLPPCGYARTTTPTAASPSSVYATVACVHDASVSVVTGSRQNETPL